MFCLLCLVSISQTKPKKVIVNYSIGLSLSNSTENNIKTKSIGVDIGINVMSKKYNTTAYINAVRIAQSNGIKSNGINFNVNLDNIAYNSKK